MTLFSFIIPGRGQSSLTAHNPLETINRGTKRCPDCGLEKEAKSKISVMKRGDDPVATGARASWRPAQRPRLDLKGFYHWGAGARCAKRFWLWRSERILKVGRSALCGTAWSLDESLGNLAVVRRVRDPAPRGCRGSEISRLTCLILSL
jgi:hypothetical protein